MPERGNDRLESFFKKVSGRPDISYEEEDWKKLEARLDAKEMRSSVAKRNRNRIAGASAIAVLLVGGLYWLSQPSFEQPSAQCPKTRKHPSAPRTLWMTTMPLAKDLTTEKENNSKVSANASNASVESLAATGTAGNRVHTGALQPTMISEASGQNSVVSATEGPDEVNQTDFDQQSAERSVETLVAGYAATQINDMDRSSASDDIKTSPATADKIKQKANTADSVVMEKNGVKVIDAYGSGLTEHPASPRLSLLLSIAPDFSTVAFDYYTDPGQSFGLMVHYHVKALVEFLRRYCKEF